MEEEETITFPTGLMDWGTNVYPTDPIDWGPNVYPADQIDWVKLYKLDMLNKN